MRVGGIYHRRYQEADKVQDDGTEIEWPVPYWFVDVGGTMQTIWLAAVNEGLGCGFVGTDDLDALRAALGIPGEFTPIGVMPVGRPLPGRAVTQPQARLGAVRAVRSLGPLGLMPRVTSVRSRANVQGEVARPAILDRRRPRDDP